MGLFSFLFSKNKIIRSTQEAETFRQVFREDEELFQKVGKSDDLKRFLELEEYVNSPLFKKRKKEIEALSYKNSEYYKAEKQYKALLKSKKLQAYYLIHDSLELKGYEKVKNSELYQDYVKLRVVVTSAGFDKKLHAAEYEAYRNIVREPKIAALIKLEKFQKFKDYCEIKNTQLPQEFEQLTAYVQSDEFRQKREYLLNKNRYETTEDYQLYCEYTTLQKRPDIARYVTLLKDPYFNGMRKWQLVFEDDFNTGRLDETKWITRYYAGERFLNDTYGVGEDVQLFTADNITFNNSAVCLNFRKESIVGKYWHAQFGIREKEYAYTSAMISTAAAFRQKYGRFEAKIKLSHSAVQQCFWMLGETDTPHIEIVKNTAEGVDLGHIYAYRASLASSVQPLKDVGLANEYYIFTLEWTENKLVWMVNDLVVKEIRENIPDIPMYVIFSLGTQQVPADKYVPAKMEIDWVRIYKLKN